MQEKWYHVTFWLTLVVLFEAVALYSLRKYMDTKQTSNLYLGMLMYGVAVPLLIVQLLTYEGIGLVNFLWNVFSTISGFLIGILIFSENVEYLQWVGVALGFLSFALIIMGSVDQKV